jgi:class 3 adenylate cyclase
MSGSVVIGHIFFLKVRSYERKALALRMALNGSVSPSQMEVMSRNPDQVNLEPRERVLTLMFIDIVGFSLSSENMLPRMAFENLKNILAEISTIIYAHGGAIDKTLGDGLLCYFGYRVESDQTVADHPENAVRCAMEIQAKVLDECLEAMKTGAPLYPVRIGINTASCYLGDIGSGQRIEFTVVGNGVNFAKRLESACDIFSVMIGSTTYEMVKGLEVVSQYTARKMIKIKHHAELIDAYEIRSLDARKEDCERAVNGFRWASSLQRVHERMPVNDADSLIVSTEYGAAEVVNFSGSGISLLLKQSLVIGSKVKIDLDSRHPGLASEMRANGLEQINAEIRWSYQSARGFVHGMMFLGFNPEQQKEFMRLVVHYAFSHETDNGGGLGDDDASKVG